MTQRAKVGYCPCCTGPSHVALPSRYRVGKYSSRDARGIQLWKDPGPRLLAVSQAPFTPMILATYPPRGIGLLSHWR